MPILSTLAVASIAIAAMLLVLAEQEVHLKIHVTKFYVTPIGQQCSYNSCVDPSIYPCAHGVCVRLNYTYGICSNDSKAMSVEQDYNDPKLLCPYLNPYNPTLGTGTDHDDDVGV